MVTKWASDKGPEGNLTPAGSGRQEFVLADDPCQKRSTGPNGFVGLNVRHTLRYLSPVLSVVTPHQAYHSIHQTEDIHVPGKSFPVPEMQ